MNLNSNDGRDKLEFRLRHVSQNEQLFAIHFVKLPTEYDPIGCDLEIQGLGCFKESLIEIVSGMTKWLECRCEFERSWRFSGREMVFQIHHPAELISSVDKPVVSLSLITGAISVRFSMIVDQSCVREFLEAPPGE